MNEQTEQGVVMLPKVRCAFLHLEKPHAPPNATDQKYSADFLLDINGNPEHQAAWNQLFQEIFAMAQAKWGEMANAVFQQINANPKLRGYGDGSTRTKKDMTVLDGYQGMMYISAKNPQQPFIIGSDGRAVDPTNTLAQNVKKPYSGCYVHALVRVWLQDNQFGRGIRFDLQAVQFAEDGPAFGPAHMDAQTAQSHFKPIAGAPAPVAAPGMPAPGMPQPAMPQPGMPQPGMPQPGMPQPGMPQPGVQQGQWSAGTPAQQQNIPAGVPQPAMQPPWEGGPPF